MDSWHRAREGKALAAADGAAAAASARIDAAAAASSGRLNLLDKIDVFLDGSPPGSIKAGGTV